MAQNNHTNILAAFAMLLEEIAVEVELVNRVGAEAFSESNYERAQAAIEQGKQLNDFRNELAVMEERWRYLSGRFEIEPEEAKVVRSTRRNLGQVEYGRRTPEDAFRLPILRALIASGGSGKTRDVLKRVREMMKDSLTKVDYESVPSKPGYPRWQKAAQWARIALVNEGLMKNDSPRGIWEISEAGQKYVKAHDNNPLQAQVTLFTE